jgi:hypothetical protein
MSLAPALAVAQTPAPAPAPPAQPVAPAAPPASAAPAGSLGGYAWNNAKPAPARGWVHRARGPEATLPGFETLADGTTRLFVQLTKTVPVEERKTAGTVTYVLKGAHVGIWNNTNALVTTHFNTPVTRARLVPHGADIFFVVELRANVAPAFRMASTKDGTAMLQVEFAKGEFLNGAPSTIPTPQATSTATPAAPSATSPAPAPSASATAPR